ncbi:phage tail tape measure protein [Hyphomicrobium sulfonivorans]|uniref:phage tail tape measure protein n=1 Tax=Hyphomicrobium sulfonivorans TaxID=121290 RepID=UPI001570F2E0|nr:phage tail tape measure protein [Hyphomicrobium sulfonivorans]MBI1649885.1 phage tail tape measure protein [Hyphomicrobium sulfonivorans]NSL71796.1 phage tail tape measure protein [Hyphomicrobium sulfonivorans]
MADKTSRLIVQLIDRVSGPAAKAAAGLRQLVGASHTQATAARGTYAAAQRDMKILRRGADRVSSSVAMPLGMIGAMGAKTAYEFAKAGNNMQAVTGMTDDQRKSIEDLAVQLNEKFPHTLGDIMGSAFELGRAGFDFDKIRGALESTLALALAGDINLPESADIATNILTAMRLPQKTTDQVASSLERVNDVLSYVATNSNTDVRMMGETFKYVGPMAAAAGMSIEEVGAAAMLMASNGIRASEAGVALRSALVRMVRPTKPMMIALDRLGVKVADFVKGGRQISGKDIIGSLMADGIDASPFEQAIDKVLADPKLQKSTAAMTEAIASIIDPDGTAMDKSKLADAITDTLTSAGSEVDFLGFMQALREKGASLDEIARIFDARQGSRLITLLAGDLNAALKKIEDGADGATKAMAEKRMKGIVGDVNELTAAYSNLWIAIAESGVMKTAGEAFKFLAEKINELSKANPQLLEWGTYAALAAVAIAPLSMALTGLAGAVGIVVGVVGLLATILTSWPLLLAIGAAAIWYFWDDIKDFAGKAGSAISDFAYSIRDGLAEGSANLHEWANGLGAKIQEAINGGVVSLFEAGAQMIQSLWDGLKSKAGEILAWASGLAGRIGSALKSVVGLGGGGGASDGAAAGASPPARARGGQVQKGRAYLVGEHRPEIFVPGQSGYMNSRADQGGGGSNGPGPVSVTMNVTINGGDDPGRLQRELDRAVQNAFRGIYGDTRTNFAY